MREMHIIISKPGNSFHVSLHHGMSLEAWKSQSSAEADNFDDEIVDQMAHILGLEGRPRWHSSDNAHAPYDARSEPLSQGMEDDSADEEERCISLSLSISERSLCCDQDEEAGTMYLSDSEDTLCSLSDELVSKFKDVGMDVDVVDELADMHLRQDGPESVSVLPGGEVVADEDYAM